MTEEEKKNAIVKLQELNKTGVITDEEFVDKVSKLEVTTQNDQHSEYRAGNKENDQGNGKSSFVLVAIICLILLLLLCFILGQGNQTNDSASTNNGNSSIASSYIRDTTQTSSLRSNANETDSLIIAIAQEFVKMELKNPSSAKFPWGSSDYTITKLNGNWVVKGYVDAQNSFGATVRSKFESCFTLEWVNGKDHSAKVYTLIYE